MARLIGTAGHVDHGKTTLIRALTGIDADRLPEEKKRGMTIDIGFAYIDFPEIGRVSIVDVPGHEKFIHNMLVGALGVDVVLLCVAADEGVKPQTREHFDIIRLLPAQKMVVALTRADLADEDTRELAKLDVESLLDGTRFEDSPILSVSAVTGEGLDELRKRLVDGLAVGDDPSPVPSGHRPSPTRGGGDSSLWYLPIDRVFSVKGHGVVVTGTLARGVVLSGDRALIQPGNWEVRVRGIHRHDEPAESAEPGSRVALNLAGLKLEDIHRGMAVGAPGSLFETQILDAEIEWLVAPKHNQRVRVSVGSEEAIGKVFLSNSDDKVAQFRLESTVAVALDQPLIVRRFSPMELMGGGRVVVPLAKVRRRSEKATIASGLPDAEAILAGLGEDPNGVATEEICRRLGKTPQVLGPVFEKLLEGEMLQGYAGLWFSKAGFDEGTRRLLIALEELHQANPRVATLPREKVVSHAKLTWAGKPLDRIVAHLAQQGVIRADGTAIKSANFQVELTEKQTIFLARVKESLEAQGVNVPSVNELSKAVPAPVQAVDEILRLGIEAGEIVRVGDGLYYTRTQIEGLTEELRQAFKGKPFAASEFRDRFGTSRKYTIPLLEYFDSRRVTLRQGDLRNVS